jgi:hypothetical protein
VNTSNVAGPAVPTPERVLEALRRTNAMDTGRRLNAWLDEWTQGA